MNKLTVYFIRHGTTGMNQQGRFCGTTDALLAPEGWVELHTLKENYEYPAVERVYSSPAVRCLETASVFYPDQEPIRKENFWELDFGLGEKAPASELTEEEYFQRWVRQEPDASFPQGESLLEGNFRALLAMTNVIKECRQDDIHTIAVVAHGAILARLMQAAIVPQEQADSFILCPNGMGLVGSVDMDEWFHKQEIRFEGFLPEGAPRLKPEDSPYFSGAEE